MANDGESKSTPRILRVREEWNVLETVLKCNYFKTTHRSEIFLAVQSVYGPSRYPSYGTSYAAPTTYAAPASTTPVP